MPSSTRPTGDGGRDLESWVDKIVDDVGKDGSITKQILLGGGTGWMTGFLAMKVGKVAATAVGGGIILLQIAQHKGYININWNRVNRDVETLSQQMKDKRQKADWTEKLERKLDQAADRAEALMNKSERGARRWYQKLAYGQDPRVHELQLFFTAFAAGVAIGLITGR